jgi:N-acetylglutamate synthase-like GNAT family acetyltransferase
MSLTWTLESPAFWDADKARIIGGAPKGAVAVADPGPGAVLPGQWWRAERDGQVVAYGWMDVVWGDGEATLAVDPAAQEGGVGTWVLDQLEAEAGRQGLNYIYNTVRSNHPLRDAVTAWLEARHFERAQDRERLQRPVRSARS